MRSSIFALSLSILPLAAACGMFTGVDSSELGGESSDAGGTSSDGGSRRDSGSRSDGGSSSHDGGGAHDSGGGGLGAQCTALESCCTTLDPSISSSCNSAVSSGVESTCSNTLNTYQADGYCGGTVKPPFDAGVLPTLDGGALDACSLLQTCCLGGASADTTCIFTAIGGNQSACATALASYVSSGICN